MSRRINIRDQHGFVEDDQSCAIEIERLRRISLVLSVALAAVVARMVIDGPKLLGDLAGALILVLLLCSLALRRQGRRLQLGPSPERRTSRAVVTSAELDPADHH